MVQPLLSIYFPRALEHSMSGVDKASAVEEETTEFHLTRFERLCEEQFQTMRLTSQDWGVMDECPGEEGSVDEVSGEAEAEAEAEAEDSGQHKWDETGEEGGDEVGRLVEARPACLLTDHCPNPCGPYVWDEEGEHVVDISDCRCDCCSGKCSCREHYGLAGTDDDHRCIYGGENDMAVVLVGGGGQ